MRFSQQRETVKNIVRGTNSHPTAEWVYTQTKKIIPNISLGTVYRNLKTLQQTGQINIIHDGPVARYDWNLETHHHLKCIECGEIVDINKIDTNVQNFVEKNYDFKVSEIDLTILGACSKHNNQEH